MENILEKINKAGLTLLETVTPEETYEAAVNEAKSLVAAEYASILLANQESLKRVYASDPFFAKLKVKRKGDVETTYKENKVIVKNITPESNIDPIIREKGIQSIIIIPLSSKRETIGVLTVLSLNKEHFNNKEVDMLRVFGSMVSFAIKKAQLYSETKKALAIRDMFISMAAHELRTPLTSLSGYIQLLHGKLANRGGSEGKWIEALYEENKRMMLLVKEILEVNRIRAGQIQFRWQECNLEQLISQSINSVLERFLGREITYKNTLKDEAIVVGDSERLVQVIDNVLDNALKYSPSSTKVEVTLKLSSNFYSVFIKDYGKGIDAEDLPNIFAGQHQGQGGEEGFGLGLFFVENVIRQHRGSLNVKSKLKKGTTIELKLPKSKVNIISD